MPFLEVNKYGKIIPPSCINTDCIYHKNKLREIGVSSVTFTRTTFAQQLFSPKI